jgi:hypothetical protein
VTGIRAILVDIDGTIALNNSGRPWYGEGYEKRIYEDDVNDAVNSVITYLIEDGDDMTPFAEHILFVSGRMEAGRAETVRWLTRKARQYRNDYTLLMRRDKDTRSDVEIKTEIYNEHIRGVYDVRLALDDKPELINLWRSLGIPAWQVNEYR